jgi:hypothetical protein
MGYYRSLYVGPAIIVSGRKQLGRIDGKPGKPNSKQGQEIPHFQYFDIAVGDDGGDRLEMLLRHVGGADDGDWIAPRITNKFGRELSQEVETDPHIRLAQVNPETEKAWMAATYAVEIARLKLYYEEVSVDFVVAVDGC